MLVTLRLLLKYHIIDIILDINDQLRSYAYNADIAWQVVTGFPSFMVDVPETALGMFVFLVKPRDGTI